MASRFGKRSGGIRVGISSWMGRRAYSGAEGERLTRLFVVGTRVSMCILILHCIGVTAGSGTDMDSENRPSIKSVGCDVGIPWCATREIYHYILMHDQRNTVDVVHNVVVVPCWSIHSRRALLNQSTSLNAAGYVRAWAGRINRAAHSFQQHGEQQRKRRGREERLAIKLRPEGLGDTSILFNTLSA